MVQLEWTIQPVSLCLMSEFICRFEECYLCMNITFVVSNNLILKVINTLLDDRNILLPISQSV